MSSRVSSENLISEQRTRELAKLARLDLSDAEVELFTQQMAQILSHVEVLRKIPTEGVTPYFGSGDSSRSLNLREDQAESFTVDEEGFSRVMSEAPDAENGQFRVPLVISE